MTPCQTRPAHRGRDQNKLQEEKMEKMVKIIETPKGKIELSQIGEGSPILYLHGSLSNCNNDMGYQPLIDAGYSIITPSRPGYGNTPVSSGKTAEQAADLLNELLIYLKLDSVIVIAVSGGGLTGVYFAAKYPEKVKKLVLESAVSKPLSEEKERYKNAQAFYGKGHKFIWGLLNFIGRVSKRSLVKKTYELFSTGDIQSIMREIKREEIDAVVKFYQKKPENIGALNDLEHTITENTFESIKAPTLIVHSKEDRAVPFAHAENSKSKIINSELFIAETWGHFILIGKGSNEVNRKVISFIAQ
jgi:pimeloyl-ACP methyl ester carboxylesterase